MLTPARILGIVQLRLFYTNSCMFLGMWVAPLTPTLVDLRGESDASHLASGGLVFLAEMGGKSCASDEAVLRSPFSESAELLRKKKEVTQPNFHLSSPQRNLPCVDRLFKLLWCLFGIVWRVSEIFKRREGEQGRGCYLLVDVVVIISVVLYFLLLKGCPSLVCGSEDFCPSNFNTHFSPFFHLLGKFLRALDQLSLPPFQAIPFSERPALRIKYPVTGKGSF